MRLYLVTTPIESLKTEIINVINNMSNPKKSIQSIFGEESKFSIRMQI